MMLFLQKFPFSSDEISAERLLCNIFLFPPSVKSLHTCSGSSPVEIDATLDLAVVLEFPQQIVAPVSPSVPTMCSPYTPASSAMRSMCCHAPLKCRAHSQCPKMFMTTRNERS